MLPCLITGVTSNASPRLVRQASRQAVLITNNIREIRTLLYSASSRGDYEAIELRSGVRNQYDDHGVLQTAKNVRSVPGVGPTTRNVVIATQ